MKRKAMKIIPIIFLGLFTYLNADSVENPYCKEMDLCLVRISELREARSRLQYELSDMLKSTPLAGIAQNISMTEGSELGRFISGDENSTTETIRAIERINNSIIKFCNDPNSGSLISVKNRLQVDRSYIPRMIPEDEYSLWMQEAESIKQTRLAMENSIAGVNAIIETKKAVQLGAEITGELINAGACFIATAAYGTPMVEEIDDLRWYRDNHMLTNPVGEFLVDVYYAVSPPIADIIAKDENARAITRTMLQPIVSSVHKLRYKDFRNSR